MSHSIRLRGPWEFAIAGIDGVCRVDFPCGWGELPAGMATVGLRRCFHLPTGLGPADRVLLVLRSSASQVAARLNGGELALQEQPDGSLHADVTGRLIHRNELSVDLTLPSPAPSHSRDPILEATLQIHPA